MTLILFLNCWSFRVWSSFKTLQEVKFRNVCSISLSLWHKIYYLPEKMIFICSRGNLTKGINIFLSSIPVACKEIWISNIAAFVVVVSRTWTIMWSASVITVRWDFLKNEIEKEEKEDCIDETWKLPNILYLFSKKKIIMISSFKWTLLF